MDNKFIFDLGQTVQIVCSGETGTVIGRAEFTNAEHSYNIRYKCGDGRAVESWWTVSALAAA